MSLPIREIAFTDFVQKYENKSINILDVREAWENPQIEGDHVTRIPIRIIQESVDLISRTDELIVICQHGIRSKAVVEFLQNEHHFDNLINLHEGVSNYSR